MSKDLPATQLQPTAAPVAPDRLLLSARQLAALLSISLATLWRWDASGALPRAVKIGAVKRWRAAEIREWCQAGCPPRAEWDRRAVR